MSRWCLPRRAGWAFAFFLALLTIPAALQAGEPLGPLSLRMEVKDVQADTRLAHAGEGIALLDAALQSFVPAEELQVRVLRPDGSAWAEIGRTPRIWVLRPGPEGDEPLEAGPELSGALSMAAGEVLRLALEVPLLETAIHEIIVAVSGLGPGGEPLRTEAMVRAPLGVKAPGPKDDGEVAEFPAVTSQEEPL
jgi:hypothetical protein